MRHWMAAAAVTLIVGGAALPALASPPRDAARGGGWGPGGRWGRLWDPETVEEVTGVVVGVERFTPYRGMSHGTHLVVRTGALTIAVHLGPSWFLERQDFRFRVNDRVVVRGSRVTYGGKPAIIATDVVRGKERLRLRDGEGIPLWAAWRENP